jgi:hypothetical protein
VLSGRHRAVIPEEAWKYSNLVQQGSGRENMPNRTNSDVLKRETQGVTLWQMDRSVTPTIRDLYPHFSEKELAEAQDNLDRYLTFVLRILERVELEANAQAAQLTPNAGTLSFESPGSQSSK